MAKFIDIAKITKKAVADLTTQKNLRILGEDAKSLIQKRTRLGGGVEKSLGPRTKLNKLSTLYKKQRKRFKGRGQLDSTTTPAKSNLTQTGGMLRDIGVKIKGLSVIIRFITPFAKKKAKWVQDAGRNFFYISKPEFRQLQNRLVLKVQKILNKIK